MAVAGSFGYEDLLRQLTPQVLTAIIRRYGDFGEAEDAVQEALFAAVLQWPRSGVPDNPRGWLIQVAGRRMKDYIRSELARRHREMAASRLEPTEPAVVPDPEIVPDEDGTMQADGDDTLTLLFMCCHPALTQTSAIALTLRAVGGLTTSEIANAYMVPEATMAQRISRAKRRLRASGIPFRMPTAAERRNRLGAVMHVLYLIFNEGYATSSSGLSLQRVDLSSEAIRLARMLYSSVPDEAEAAGLLSLMLLTHARRDARIDADGRLVPLAEQDRSRWDRRAIDEGVTLLTAALARGEVGPYQLQAAIAALHDTAPSWKETDWPQILALYGLLQRMSDNPMITLNRAVAVAMVHGPQSGLKALAPLDDEPRIAQHHRLAAVRAHLYEMLGEREQAAAQYMKAAERTRNIQERNYLVSKAGRCSL